MKKRKQERYLGIGLVVLAALLMGVIVKAQVSSSFWDDAAHYFGEALAGRLDVPEDKATEFGASGTRFPSGLAVGTTSPAYREALFNTTTTLQEVTYGSRYNAALIFTAGSTSTPGGLFTLQNTGESKVCYEFVLDRSVADGGDKVAFTVATSTLATSWSGEAAGTIGIIASSTMPTSTLQTLNMVDHGGITSDSWVWDNGAYLLGAFEITNQEGSGLIAAASSTDYVDNVGEIYVTCHTR